MSSSKPKICILSFASYPLFNPVVQISHGGAEVEMYGLATEWAKQGYSVHVVVGDFDQPKTETRERVMIWRGQKIRASGFFKGCLNTLRLLNLLRKIDADIYLTKGAGFLPFQVAVFCLLFKKKFILKTSHRYNIDLSLRRKFYHPFYAWALRHTYAFVTQNKEDLPLAKKNYGVVGQVIKNYQKIPKPESLVPCAERKHLLWVGRLVAIKHPEVFVELAGIFKNEPCVMVAFEVKSDLLKHIQEKAKHLKNFHLILNKPYHQMSDFYKNAKLLVCSSEAEGFPNTFIEAMKWGVPIASLTVDPDQTIQKKGFGVMGNDYLPSFFKSIEDFLNDKEKRQKTGQKAYQYAQKEFGENPLKEWEKLFSADDTTSHSV